MHAPTSPVRGAAVPTHPRGTNATWARIATAAMVLAALAACRPGGTYLGLPADKPSLATPAPPATSLPRRPSVASAHQPTSGLAGLIAALPRFEPPPVARPISVHSGPSAPIFSRLPVTAPVAFLTIDDGIVQLPSDLALMNAAHIPFTMFLIGPVAAANPGFFARLEADGGVIEDHTMTHPILRGRSYAFQRSQICGARTTLAQAFDGTPTLFRPPYGDYDRTTLRVVHDCGLTAAINWSETVRNGKVYYQTSVHKVRPGDIILMHFRTTFAEDLKAALIAIHQAGLTPALLTDYITATPATRRLTAVAPDPANPTSLRAS